MDLCRMAVVASLFVVAAGGNGRVTAGAAEPSGPGSVASLADAVNSRADVWGEAAMRQPNGPSYEFFKDLLPPLRYVNADFHYYPIVLSAPRAERKARLISNGSGVNLSGGARSWRDTGMPFTFRVGPDEYRFGELLDRVEGPSLSDGFLPIVEIRYRHPSPVLAAGFVPINQIKGEREDEVYRLEAFASTDPALAEHAVVLVRFSLAAGATGIITVQPEPGARVTFDQGTLTDEQGKVVAMFDPSWKWERQSAHAPLEPGAVATLAIPSHPLDPGSRAKFTRATFEQHQTQARQTWNEILDRGMKLQVPEPYVNHAWRNLVLQNFALMKGDRIHYSAGNQYDQLYEAEGSETALAMLGWGYASDVRKMLLPLLDFTRKGLEYHQAGTKLNDVCRYYRLTHDADFVRSERARWAKEVERVLGSRDRQHGLLPKEQYCGDIKTPIISFSTNAKAWRALRDLAPILDEVGDRDLAQRLRKVAPEFRAQIRSALDQSLRKETTPPFVPLALLADESVHDPITSVRIGSYWNLVINYAIASGLFPPGSEQEAWIPRYLEEHGGLCMGMTRCGAIAPTFWTSAQRIDPLYGTGYVIDTLRRDDPDRALVSFYGMLAHGFTRDTLIGGEGCDLAPVDPNGRFFYCPPNSASNGHFLAMLRHLLVQDFDLDDDGSPETLRLFFATPRRWLADGQSIRIEGAPTAFGPLSLSVRSRLAQGEVLAEADLPTRNPSKSVLLRVRLPEGWRAVSASAGGRVLPLDERGTADLSGMQGKTAVRFTVARTTERP